MTPPEADDLAAFVRETLAYSRRVVATLPTCSPEEEAAVDRWIAANRPPSSTRKLLRRSAP